jgi:CHASE3 domain sensor protein
MKESFISQYILTQLSHNPTLTIMYKRIKNESNDAVSFIAAGVSKDTIKLYQRHEVIVLVVRENQGYLFVTSVRQGLSEIDSCNTSNVGWRVLICLGAKT